MSVPVQAVDEPLYGASPKQAVRRFFSRYVVFTGRASRSEFWWTYLFVLVVVALLGIVGTILGTLTATPADRLEGRVGGAVAFAPITILLFVLGILVPAVALIVRRLHDVNLSGLLLLIWLVPYLGPAAVMVMCILPSQPMGRRYDRAATMWVPPGPPAPGTAVAYGQFGASPYGQPHRSLIRSAPEAADLAHALGPLLGRDRGAVAAVARRFGAYSVEEGVDVQRLVMPDSSVVVRFDGMGRLAEARVEPV